MKKIAVLGSGSWGTALAMLLNKNGHKVMLWSSKEEKAEKIRKTRVNGDFLPDVKIDERIDVTSCDDDVKGADIVLLTVSSKYVRSTCERFKKYIENSDIIINAAKGFEERTLMRLSQVIGEVFPKNKVAVLSGPSHAEEVCRDMPTACVAAAEDIETAREVQGIFMAPSFRVYTNTDIVGVELGGALKNLIALAAGISDGVGFGDNAKAALMTRGLHEISKLGIAMGAKAETFAGLSGIGDLIVTCTSMHSRNRRAGILLGKGKSIDEALSEIKMAVEGITNAKAAYELAKKYNVEMPITREINRVLFEGIKPKDSVVNLMTRDKTAESLVRV
ncbi:MAG: NAD(P)H-dependent glycerol-3-phosphate dehydrogenase [Firmicutes bacterium]|nr:NAD(P)H-dependent glycerol-3-phosphate dehydrogenase [Bacillota bacterium]